MKKIPVSYGFSSHAIHAGVSLEKRREFSITDGLVRLSVGIENVADIIDDLDRAMVKI